MANATNGKRILDILSKLVVTLMILAVSWGGSVVFALREDVTAIQSSRFTTSDGIAMRREMALMKEALQAEITLTREMIATLPQESPQPWFKADVDQIKVELRALTKAVTRLESRVGRRFDRNDGR